MRYAIGIDLGGTSIKAMAISADGKVLSKINRPFDADRKFEWAEKIRTLIPELQSQQDAAPVALAWKLPGAPGDRPVRATSNTRPARGG